MPSLTDDERDRRLTFGRQALAIACDRLNALEAPGDPDLIAVSATVAECLVWISAVEDLTRLGKRSTLMTALRWARNAAIHDVVVRAEKATEGIFILDVRALDGGDRLAHSRWVERAALGAVRISKPVGGDAAYDAELAGQPVVQTIRTARALLDADFAEDVARDRA